MLLLRRVVGKSMLPTFQAGQVVVCWRRCKTIKPGDVVIFRHDGLEKVKRVARVHKHEIFVIGDNHAQSTDSRSFGTLPRSSIIAKVIWPLK